jgi:hypothetical protein
MVVGTNTFNKTNRVISPADVCGSASVQEQRGGQTFVQQAYTCPGQADTCGLPRCPQNEAALCGQPHVSAAAVAAYADVGRAAATRPTCMYTWDTCCYCGARRGEDKATNHEAVTWNPWRSDHKPGEGEREGERGYKRERSAPPRSTAKRERWRRRW